MFFLKAFSYLPLGLLYVFAYKVYFLAYYIVGYRKKVVDHNLKIAFPEKSDKERKSIRKAFYKNLAQVFVEILKTRRLKPSEVKKRVTFTRVDEVIDENKTYLCMTSHFANWEWIFAGSSLVWPIRSVSVYKRLSNAKFDKFMLDIRQNFGGKSVEMRESLRFMIKSKSIPTAYGLVADQSPAKSEVDKYFDFFGLETPFYTGTEKLALSLNHEVLYLKMTQLKRGHYNVELLPIRKMAEEQGVSITQMYVQVLEEHIKEQPHLWLWSHRRFKHSKNK